MRPNPLAGILLALISGAACADTIAARDGRFEADVSARNITRIAIEGEKVVTVRKIDDAQGPKVSVDVDGSTGDVFVNFDGDVVGRTFSVFLTTQSGKTLEAVLSPRDRDAQTVLVRVVGEAAGSPAQAGEEEESGRPAPAPADGRGERHEGYPEILTALIRLMFNGVDAPGVERLALNTAPKSAGAFQMQVVETYSVGDLRGTILSLRNTSPIGQPLNARTFLARGVLAAAVSHETVEPGQYARVYIVEATAGGAAK
jgi:hypothetical protein